MQTPVAAGSGLGASRVPRPRYQTPGCKRAPWRDPAQFNRGTHDQTISTHTSRTTQHRVPPSPLHGHWCSRLGPIRPTPHSPGPRQHLLARGVAADARRQHLGLWGSLASELAGDQEVTWMLAQLGRAHGLGQDSVERCLSRLDVSGWLRPPPMTTGACGPPAPGCPPPS
jgi:hypothetical protein